MPSSGLPLGVCPRCHATQPKYYRPDQVISLLKISRRTLYYWIERGIIEVIRIPGTGTIRIPAEALEKILGRERQAAQ